MRTLAAALVFVFLAPSARASDFWDEVRTPGLRAYRARLAQATAALEVKRAPDALAHARWAAQRLETRPEAHLLLGRAARALERHEEAVLAFARASALDPGALDDPSTAGAVAASAIAIGRLDFAERVLRRALARLGGAERRALLVWHGDVLQALGPTELARAMLSYREALRERPERDARALLGLALALHRIGEPDQAFALARDIADGTDTERELDRVAPLPATERAARTALRLDAIGDRAGAAEAWNVVARGDGPWSDHARRAARATPAARR